MRVGVAYGGVHPPISLPAVPGRDDGSPPPPGHLSGSGPGGSASPRLRGFHHLADVITDVRFINGVNEKETGRKAAGEAKNALSLKAEVARNERAAPAWLDPRADKL
ncbi:MAG: hypothetical protein F4X91_15825 [Nitrospinae bacterium]|nr:hypothetical protein [Nitrospinota bacterium]